MTKIVKRELYCSKCKKTFVQPVYMSVSSFLMSEEEKRKMEDGTLFKNFCPECGNVLTYSKDENGK